MTMFEPGTHVIYVGPSIGYKNERATIKDIDIYGYCSIIFDDPALNGLLGYRTVHKENLMLDVDYLFEANVEVEDYL